MFQIQGWRCWRPAEEEGVRDGGGRVVRGMGWGAGGLLWGATLLLRAATAEMPEHIKLG